MCFVLVNTPLPIVVGIRLAPVCYVSIIQSSKCFWAINSWESPILHRNNYLPKFFIINSFNLYSLNRFRIIILFLSGQQPICQLLNQTFQRLISLSGPAHICPKWFTTLNTPESLFFTTCSLLLFWIGLLCQWNVILFSVNLISLNPLVFHSLFSNSTLQKRRPWFHF